MSKPSGNVSEVEPGSIVFNYGDAQLRERGMSARGALIRMLAYLPFTPRIYVPGSMLIRGGPALEALRLAPCLLEEGVVVPDRLDSVGSFEELAVVKGLDGVGEAHGAWLDQHARNWRRFCAEDLQPLFRAQVINDFEPAGRFEAWAKRQHLKHDQGRNDLMIDHFARVGAGSPELLTDAAHTVSDDRTFTRTIERWARFRYYTVPALRDFARVREVPGSLSGLATDTYVIHPTAARDQARSPFSDAEQKLATSFVAPLDGDGQASYDALAQAILESRKWMPLAQQVSSQVLAQSSIDGYARDVSSLIEEEYMRQLRLAPGGYRRTEIATAATVGVVLAFLTSYGLPAEWAFVVSGFATAVEVGRRLDARTNAPWPLMISKVDRIGSGDRLHASPARNGTSRTKS